MVPMAGAAKNLGRGREGVKIAPAQAAYRAACVQVAERRVSHTPSPYSDYGSGSNGDAASPAREAEAEAASCARALGSSVVDLFMASSAQGKGEKLVLLMLEDVGGARKGQREHGGKSCCAVPCSPEALTNLGSTLVACRARRHML